jgi:hypothetical protein
MIIVMDLTADGSAAIAVSSAEVTQDQQEYKVFKEPPAMPPD